MKRFRELLDQLTLQLDTQAITLQDASRLMAEFIHSEIRCSRVSVWLLEATADGPVMRRIAGFDGVHGVPLTEVVTLCNPEFASYFEAITSHGVYVSDDTLADPQLSAMRESYLVPNDIRAALYATIGANGSTWALLCCSQSGEPRRWAAPEVRALKAYADAISLRRARRRQREAEAASMAQRLLIGLGTPSQPLLP